MSERLYVGVVIGAHGIKGGLRIKSFTADPADLTRYGKLQTDSGQAWQLRQVTIGVKGVVTAHVDGVTERSQAEAVKGVKLYAERAALPALVEDEFYVADLIGMDAVSIDGAPLGKIKAVFDFGAGDIIEVSGEQGDLMLPFTKRVVQSVDLAAKRVVIDPPLMTEGEDGHDGSGD